MSNDETVGMGFNSQTGLAVGSPFIHDQMVVEADPQAPGMEVFSTVSIINTHEELMKSLGLAVEGEGRYGFFSASLKAQFSEQSNYNSMSTFVTAKVLAQSPFQRGRNFVLDAPAKALIEAVGQADVFTTAFGDSFVRGVQTGGELYLVMRVTSVSETTQQQLAASLQAAYQGLAAAASFKADFEMTKQSAQTRSEFAGMMYQRAGSGEGISVVLTIEEGLQRIRDFPGIAEASPVAYEIEVATYDTVPLPLRTPEEEEDFLLALHDARAKKLLYVQTKNDLEFVRLHRDMFINPPPVEEVVGLIVEYTRLISAVMSHGIELATGRMRPPRMFEPTELGLTVPAPVELIRGAQPDPKPVEPPPPATLTVPDLVGRLEAELSGAELTEACRGFVLQVLPGAPAPTFSTAFSIVPGRIVNQSPPAFTVVPNQSPQNNLQVMVFTG